MRISLVIEGEKQMVKIFAESEKEMHILSFMEGKEARINLDPKKEIGYTGGLPNQVSIEIVEPIKTNKR